MPTGPASTPRRGAGTGRSGTAPVAVPGVITTSTSSKIDCTRAASVTFGGPDPAHLRIGDQPAETGIARVRGSSRSGCGNACDVVVGAAPHPRQHMTVDGPRRVVGITPDHLVAELAQQRSRLRPSPSAAPADAGRPRGGTLVLNAIRSRPGSRPPLRRTRPTEPRCVVVASRNNAASSTVRAIGPLTLRPHHASSCGAIGTRSRCGLRPNSPHQVDGIRIDPAPSEPSAIGASPAATAAPLPPLLPPGVQGQIPRIAGGAERHGLGERPEHHLRNRRSCPGSPRRPRAAGAPPRRRRAAPVRSALLP